MVDPRTTDRVRITFGMIVLNGEPFTRYNLRSLYPYAHQIIVVEGACPAAKNVATDDGHSRDATLETLRRFKSEEDPGNKLVIVTAEDEGHPNGFWPGEKDEMSQAYAKRATGNYLWQVDSDEFYRDEDINQIMDMLRHDPSITAVTFKQMSFWGSIDCVVDGHYLIGGAANYHRLFKWGPGYSYATHRPPTVVDETGVDLRKINWKTSSDLGRKGIYLYHYSLLFPKQVQEKCDYYGNVDWAKRDKAQSWADKVFRDLKRPFRVHNVYEHLSWLERYDGQHPAAVIEMMNDIASGALDCEMRDNADVDALLNSRVYYVTKCIMRQHALIVCSRPAQLISRVFYPLTSRICLAIRNPKYLFQSLARRCRSLLKPSRV